MVDRDTILSALHGTDDDRRRAALRSIVANGSFELADDIRRMAVVHGQTPTGLLAVQAWHDLRAAYAHAQMRQWLKELGSDSATQRTPALEKLAGAGREAWVAACQVLREHPLPSAARRLLAWMADEVPMVRRAAAFAAPHQTTTRWSLLPGLFALLSDPDPLVRERAWISINEIDIADRNHDLEQLFTTGEPWAMTAVAPYLPVLAHPDLSPLLARLTAHPIAAVQTGAAGARRRLVIEDAARRRTTEPPVVPEEVPQVPTDIEVTGPAVPDSERGWQIIDLVAAAEETARPIVELSLTSMVATMPTAPVVSEADLGAANATEVAIDLDIDATAPDAGTPPATTAPVPLATPVASRPPTPVSPPPAATHATASSIQQVTSAPAAVPTPPAAAESTGLPSAGAVEAVPVIAGAAAASIEPPIAPEGAEVPALGQPPTDLLGVDATEVPLGSPALDETEVLGAETATFELDMGEEPDYSAMDLAKEALQEAVPLGAATLADAVEITVIDGAEPANVAPAAAAVGGDVISLARSPADEAIISEFPTFLATPYAALFVPAPAEAHIETLRTALGNLLIFLNLTFLQSYLFFGTRATNMDKFVSELLQTGLVPENPVASLNRLSLPLRGVGHRNFFTFALARLMGADNDLNPLLPIRELWEYLVNPEGPFDETLPIAQNGFGSILGMVKAMHENPLVFRVPNKRPPVYADLSGPKATALPESAWPEIDLPEGELVVLGRDRSEALGLWPFFSPTNKGIALVEPTPEQLSELLSRLELAPG